MAKPFLFCIFLLTNIFSFAQYGKKFRPDNYTIIDTSKAKALLKSCNSYDPIDLNKARVLAFSELNVLELNFNKVLYTYEGDKIGDLTRFTFQYMGVWKNNEKCIYINAFPTSEIKHKKKATWKDVPLVFCGGGQHYWRAVFNVQKKEFVYLDFNAPY